MNGLFITILNMSLAASFAAAAIILIRMPLKKAPKAFSYVLWAAVLFRLLCPVSFESAISVLPLNSEIIPKDIVYSQAPSINSGIEILDNTVNQGMKAVLPPVNPADSVNPIDGAITIGAYLWLSSAVLLICYAIYSYFKVKRRVYSAILISGNSYETDQIKTPFVMGFVKPKIYIPVGLSANETVYILKHEQTHIRRGDHLIKPLAFLALSIHWFNPLMWLSYMLMVKDMEMSCDESVLKKSQMDIRTGYSSSLLNLSVKKSGLLSPLAFGESNVKSRVKNVLSYKRPALWVVVAAVILCITLVGCLIANPKTDSSEWQPQPEYVNEDGSISDEYWEALTIANESVKTEEIVAPDMGDDEKTALAWMNAWFDMYKALPTDNMAYITEGAVDRLDIVKISKEGFPKAFVFSVTFSLRPTYPIAQNGYWMPGNTGESPGRDETWGQMYREVELRMGDDEKYHFVEMGTGGLGNNDEYDMVITSSAHDVVSAFFAAFENANYEAMKLFCTEECKSTYFHDSDVDGMKWAKAVEVTDAFDSEKMKANEYAFFISVEMETAPTSALYGETQTSFYVILVQDSTGAWLIDSFPTGL